MDEKELAAHFQATRDDEDEWGDPVEAPKAKPRRRLGAMISIRLSESELRQVQYRADELGQSVSSYVRGLALSDVNRRNASWDGSFAHGATWSGGAVMTQATVFDTGLTTGHDPLVTVRKIERLLK